MKPSVLILGAGKAPAIEAHYHHHLNALGAATRLLPVQNMFFDYYEKHLVHKILFKAGLSNIYRQINERIKQEILSHKPDIVWVFKGMEVFPETIDWIRGQHIRVANYNTDNPLFFTGPGSGNRNVTKSLGHYDLHFCYDRKVLEQMKAQYGIPCELLPFAFEGNDELYRSACSEPEIVEACFVGSPDRDRAAFLKALSKEIPLNIFGPHWSKFLSGPNIRIHPPVHDQSFWKTLHRYRVQLNLMRLHNTDSHNMRSFEVPGIGGIMLAPDTPDHRNFFSVGKEIFVYRDLNDCIAQIKQLLELNKETADTIRQCARQRSMGSGYSYAGRSQQVLHCFEALLCKK